MTIIGTVQPGSATVIGLGLKCPSCSFTARSRRALGRHQQAHSGREGHPPYESTRSRRRGKAKRRASVRPAQVAQARRLSPSGKIKELKEAVLKALDELAIHAEVQAEALRDVTAERDRAQAQLQRLDAAYQVIKGRRRPE